MLYTPLVSDLRACLGADNVLSAPSELAVYECDAATVQRVRPTAVIFPRSTGQVVDTVKICNSYCVPVVPRGAGTSLAGGCLPVGGGVVLVLTRMNRILEINLRDRMAVVEAGVQNLRLAQALAGAGYRFAPDPTSQRASTIGGNVATNAGGPHSLKYGSTAQHVLGVEAVLADGSAMRIGPVLGPAGLNLLGLLVGSEGTLGIVTKVWVRLTPCPRNYRTVRAVFHRLEDAAQAAGRILAAGIVPSALELMDHGMLAAVEEAFHFSLPREAGALLMIEVDGLNAGLDQVQSQIEECCRQANASEIHQAKTPAEREDLWQCCKLTAGATGRLCPSYILHDGVAPRSRLPRILQRVAEIGRNRQVRILTVAHAGSGNFHAILPFDEQDRTEVDRAEAAGRELLEECIACGGSISAEHGIGTRKLALMERLWTAAELEAMRRIRESFDPAGLLNTGKLLPNRP
jgi:glycolate oxidase